MIVYGNWSTTCSLQPFPQLPSPRGYSTPDSAAKNTWRPLPHPPIGGPGGAGHQHFSSCPWLSIVEAKFLVNVVKRWGFPYAVQSLLVQERLYLECGPLRIQWPLWPSPQLACEVEIPYQERQTKTRGCSLPSSSTEYPLLKADVCLREKHATVPTPNSRAVAQRFFPEGEVGVKQNTLKLVQKELSLFATESRMIQA